MARKLGIDWDSVPLGTRSDCDVAADLGCDRVAVWIARTKRGIVPFIRHATHRPTCAAETIKADLLAGMTDAAIARAHGLGNGQVRRVRGQLGIEPCRIDWDRQPLGKESDADIAVRLGVKEVRVSVNRSKRGIKKFKESKRCPCGKTFPCSVQQKFCSTSCMQAYWEYMNASGYTSDLAYVGVAIRAYKRAVKEFGEARA